MKIVIAPDSFKESMTSMEAADCIKKGFATVLPDAEYVKIPVADGGEGTVQALVDATDGELIRKTVTGPLGTPVEAVYGLLGDGKTAVIEMAEASGLHLVPPDQRNPLVTTTRGTGELILDAAEKGALHIIIGLGGSATNDGGAGMASALGVKFLNKDGCEIGDGGGSLSQIAAINTDGMHPKLKDIVFEAACDVDNPLTGPNGASSVFGPQKGASDNMVALLDDNLKHYARAIKKEMKCEADSLPGAGAAGGLGAGLKAFLKAELKSGVDIVLDTLSFSERIKGADLVITGEGKIDGQSIHGKTPVGVASRAAREGIPVIAVAGSLGEGCELVYDKGISALFSIVPGTRTLEDSLANGKAYLEHCARNIAAVWSLQ
ncbi:glycerate kinase [Bacillus glycinifermentans]|uniref:Glycerate kinase n=1 Tax=Bacillus glycinifermentans TaxID=1664069 RepID=A0A0J6EDB3_9BACI|nr:glycerate kinase [Bacillus glycinifermentans]ATH93949.1 glycerate kinase [Bacillus glycinifermentans]KMM55201.1 glycerate kinase [Bacillus glycinifermentans]KRT94109.1 glycerate kinase [Bacillus glycinifermentans]MEC0487997.1 glycerate kinase [Bacillus glycinifermentans]MEC0496513.1 glycerate kinase [Bacillus glycinifermentans]